MNPYRYCPRCGATLEHVEVDGRPRHRCSAEACDFVHWNNPTPVVAAIVEHEGRIVLARNAAWPARFYGLVTGFLEACEDPAEGVLREVKEELNLDGHEAHFVGHYPFARMNQLIIAYHVPASGTIRLNEELVDWKAFEPQQLRAWPGGTGLALRDWLRRHHGIDPPMLDLGPRRRAGD